MTHPNEDASAIARIIGISKGTNSPTWTLLRALKQVGLRDHTWNALAKALDEIWNARDDEEANLAIDDAHEALQHLRELDYDGSQWKWDERVGQ